VPRITPVDWKTLDCVFRKAGFVFDRGKGDHRSYVKSGCLRPVVIPKYKEIDIDIIKSNMRTAGMSRDEYFRYLKECK
jgi:predicted RNA binding protein YcfA (HicA-like mRNA interferase family)